ncbi:MAG: rod shape-determining protein MreD [Endomicrobium sp.]|jgi:rod shape-determining protein MreD|nr:rod shape-determining protein MreD [Endomicrobium sp.]
MKKIVVFFLICVVFCIFQFCFSSYISICGIFPNLILILVVYTGLSYGIISAEIAGFLFGLVWDAFSADVFGVRTIIFTCVGYLSGLVYKKFDKDSFFTQIILILLANIIYCFGFIFIYCVFCTGEGAVSCFISVQTILNMLATVLFAPVIFFILGRLRLFNRADV